MGNPPHAAQHDSAQGNEVGNAREDFVRPQRKRIGWKVLGITKLVERNARQQKHGSAAYFFKTINMIDVIRRIILQALLGFGYQFIAVAELGGAGGADLS